MKAKSKRGKLIEGVAHNDILRTLGEIASNIKDGSESIDSTLDLVDQSKKLQNDTNTKSSELQEEVKDLKEKMTTF